MHKSFQDLLELNRSHNDEIKKTTRILQEFFGINGFMFGRTGYDGRYFFLTDIPEVFDHLLEINTHHHSPYTRHPDSFRSGFILRDTLYQHNDNVITIDNQTYLPQNTFSFIEKSKHGVDACIFWGMKDNKFLDELALNQQHLIKKYFSYIKKEHTRFFVKGDELAADLSKIVPDNYYANVNSRELQAREALFELLKELGMTHLVESSMRLSQGERDCLRYVILGKTAKETAEYLTLSARTIEGYLDNARRKLDCQNKSDLFSIADELAKFNLL